MENQTIKKFHRRTSAPSRRPERVVLRCEHHCSPGPSAPLAPWRMARRLDRPPASRVEYDIGKRAPSASRTEIVLTSVRPHRGPRHGASSHTA